MLEAMACATRANRSSQGRGLDIRGGAGVELIFLRSTSEGNGLLFGKPVRDGVMMKLWQTQITERWRME